MPYRVDICGAAQDAAVRLIDLGAMDIESPADGRISALMPDGVNSDEITRALGVSAITVSPAIARDAGSVWVLSPRPVRGIKLLDAPAFGTGLHPTTALCLEALDEMVPFAQRCVMLDVGTGSGVLAFAALKLGVTRVVAIDLDEDAVRAAAENAHLNGIRDCLHIVRGGPDSLSGRWPLVVANILAAPLIEMAPQLVRRVDHGGVLVLSGVADSLTDHVTEAYRGLGMRLVSVTSRAGWSAILLRASW